MEMMIGKLAKDAGVGVETIRFYERKGLIKRPVRKEAGFRYYSSEITARIRFIKRAQELGFALKEVKALLDVQSKGKITGMQLEALVQEKLTEIENKISDLRRMENSLTRLLRICSEGDEAIRGCRIFDCFEKGCNVFLGQND